MEDEECLPENSDLNIYLRNLGYSDISTKNVITEKNALNFEVPESNTVKRMAGWLDKDIIEQIEVLLSTKMLFEEDVSNMEKLLSNFKIVKTGLLKSMFQSYATAFIILFGVCLYWVIGNYVFVLISVFYAYHASDYLWKKHYSQNRIKNLMTVLKCNYVLLKKTFQFIKENDILLHQNFLDSDKDIKKGFEFFENLKKEFVTSENELVRILSRATKNLINKVPLCDYIENPRYYLCNKYSQRFSEITDLSKLHQVYLLVQSEFLQRVALSLIPNLQKNDRDNYRDINKILNGTTNTLVRLESKLSKKFRFVFLNGIHFNSSKSKFKLSTTMKSNSNYAVELISNIHDTSNTLQSLLIKSRIIENEFSNEKLPKQVEDELVSIQNELDACQKNISDSVILLKKLNAITSDNNRLKTIEEVNKEIENNDDEANAVIVGYTDLDPKVEDEVFEAYLNSEAKKEKYFDDDYDFEDKLKKKLEKEYSKNVLKELKSRLVETAKKREAREENALKRKSKPNATENVSKFDKEKQNEEIKTPLDYTKIENSTISQDDFGHLKSFSGDSDIAEMDTESMWPLPRFKRCSILRKNNRIVPFKSRSSENDNHNHKETSKTDNGSFNELDKNNLSCGNPERLGNSLNLINSNFLSSINQARNKIFAPELQEEETFCDTGENSEDEEQILKSALVEGTNEKKFN